MYRYQEGSEDGGQARARPRLVPAPIPRLFQLQEPRRRLSLPAALAVVVHGAALYWVVALGVSKPQTAPQPVAVVFKKPPPPKLVEPAGGGSPPPRPKPRRKKLVVPPPPPPVAELPQPEPEPEPEPPEFVEAGDATEGVPGGTGLGTGTGTGSGTGSGSGPGTGVKSKERKAWLQSKAWRCSRPGYEELGRIVVKIRVAVRTDGNPEEVTVTRGGPEAFNLRAISCAKAEKYIPALDPGGTPIPATIEFGIEFLL